MAKQRGCGSRTKGGVYIETPLSPYGKPIEHFLIDPVKPLPEGFNPPHIGVTFVEHPVTKVVNVVDWVGATHYPNVADFVEEVRVLGLSRKVARTAPFGKLTTDSRIILIHDRAFVANPDDYSDELNRRCPKNLEGHREVLGVRVPQMCAGLWWEDVEGGEHVAVSPDDRAVMRQLPSFGYFARRRPDDVTPIYQPAIFAAFPIGRLSVIEDPEGGSHEQSLEAARAAAMWLPVVLEQE